MRPTLLPTNPLHSTILLTLIALACLAIGSAPAPAAEVRGSPFPLATCPVSGKPLGKDSVSFVIEEPDNATINGRAIRFCCPNCVDTFKKDRAKMLEAVDAAIIAQQMPLYPMTNCVVMRDEEIAAPDAPDAGNVKNVVVLNKLVRLCCPGCIKKVRRDPMKYLTAIDGAVIEKQKPTYPLKTCAVSGEPLPAEPTDIVIGERLVRLCCPKCADAARKDPSAVLAKFGTSAAAPAAPAAPAGSTAPAGSSK
ncbi:MAG: hypothetical protein EBR10_10180 [Planctomycetes bacterium]|nr:hypothetical protein [Planctomycetota bacterium]